ncbi:hypothetical protein Halha_1272 [Halobacteroides halobius DSM 5150]|uniref:Uncharacterized protein n=1 Tax=Halobacteroides halobius (strain ATCC 35273 / DSM 5150 / MD-1) TaxID=748449 RepID=L0KAV1_HALHC|nr:hypothetical protein [Halobacteroides halobius]AGB41218.1 hypothetical protein Halha_1272 [Halobacteroides halobius DSM 5150]
MNNNLSSEEITYFLHRLNKLKANNSMSQIEEGLVDFLVEQLKRQQQDSKAKEETKLESKGETTLQKTVSKQAQSNMKSLLQNKLGEFIVLKLMSDGESSSVSGVLCKMGKDFITVVDQTELVKIKLEAIVTVIESPKQTDNYCQNNNLSSQYKDQYYLEQAKKIEEELDEKLKINKQEKDYS